MQHKDKKKKKSLDREYNRIIEMAWEDRAKDIDGNWGPSFKRVVVFEDQTINRDFNITYASNR